MSNEEVYQDAPKSLQEYTDGPTVVKTEPEAVEQSDRGLFNFSGKKDEEKCEETAISSEFDEKVHVSEPEPKSEEKKESLLDKLHRSDSSSSSSSDEECEDGEKKKKKKKPLKEKIPEKFEKKEDTSIPVEKYEEVAVAPPIGNIGECKSPIPTPEPEEKKGFMEKIKEKLPVGHKKTEEEHVAPPSPVEKYEEVEVAPSIGECKTPIPTPEPEEKKGFMEKIKEKLPGGHKKTEEEHIATPPPVPAVVANDAEGEKKGIFEKIKEKIPGYHAKSEEEKEKEKVKECD